MDYKSEINKTQFLCWKKFWSSQFCWFFPYWFTALRKYKKVKPLHQKRGKNSLYSECSTCIKWLNMDLPELQPVQQYRQTCIFPHHFLLWWTLFADTGHSKYALAIEIECNLNRVKIVQIPAHFPHQFKAILHQKKRQETIKIGFDFFEVPESTDLERIKNV